LGARRTDRLEAIASEIRSEGGVAEYRALDVISLEEISLCEFAKDQFGRLDDGEQCRLDAALKLEVLKIEEWNRMIDVNIRGVLHGIAAALPIFKQQQSGQFVNLSSIGGHNVYQQQCTAPPNCGWAISEALRQEIDGYPDHGRHCPELLKLNLPAPLPMLKRRSGWRNSASQSSQQMRSRVRLPCDRAASRCGCQRDCRSTDRTERLNQLDVGVLK